MNADALLTGSEAARFLGITRCAFAQWVPERIRPTAHRGRSPLYRLADIVEAERLTRPRRRAARSAA